MAQNRAKNRVGRVYGYARASTKEQVISPEAQEERIIERAERLLDAESNLIPGDIEKENESATKSAYYERPRFARLLSILQKGDVLIVWQLHRLDRDPFRMVTCIQQLVEEKGVRVIGLEYPSATGEIDITSADGVAYLFMQGIVSKYFSQGLSNATSQALQHLKRLGRRYCHYPQIGHRFEEDSRRTLTKRGTTVKYEVLDQRECRDIAEIIERKRLGHSLESIAEDFHRRKKRRADGRRWSKPYGRERRCYVKSMMNAVKWGEAELEKTGTIGGIPVAVPPPVSLIRTTD